MFSLFIYNLYLSCGHSRSRVIKTKVGYKYICIRGTGIKTSNSRSRKLVNICSAIININFH